MVAASAVAERPGASRVGRGPRSHRSGSDQQSHQPLKLIDFPAGRRAGRAVCRLQAHGCGEVAMACCSIPALRGRRSRSSVGACPGPPPRGRRSSRFQAQPDTRGDGQICVQRLTTENSQRHGSAIRRKEGHGDVLGISAPAAPALGPGRVYCEIGRLHAPQVGLVFAAFTVVSGHRTDPAGAAVLLLRQRGQLIEHRPEQNTDRRRCRP